MIYSILFAALLFLVTGCDAFWLTPTPTSGDMVPTRAATEAPQPTATPAAARHPSPAPGLARIEIEGSSQYWSNPNDVDGLVHDGRYLWAAGRGGLVRWSEDGESRVYTTADGLASQAIEGIASDGEGRVWIGYADSDAWSVLLPAGWRTYDARREAVEEHHATLSSPIREDARLWSSRGESDWVWLPNGKGQIEAYDGETWRVYTEYNGIRPHVQRVAVGENGRVWAVGDGVSTAEEGEVWWEDHDFFTGVVDRHAVRDIAVDIQGGLWLAYAPLSGGEGGLARYDPTLQVWQGYLHELNDSLPVRAYQVFIDTDETVWLCGTQRLAYRRPARQWEAHRLDDLEAQCFAGGSEGHLWIGSARGVWSLHMESGGLSGPWNIGSPLVDNHVVGIYEQPGGVSAVDPDGGSEILWRGELFCAEQDVQGRLWLGTSQGLYRLDGEGQISKERCEPVVAIAFDGAQPVICTSEGQLLRVGLWGSRQVLDLRETLGALPRNMAVDGEGTIWLSSELGLGQISRAGDFELFTGDEELLSSDVRDVALDADGTLWVATARGLARHTPDGRWTRFTVESTGGGLQSMDMWGLHIASDNALWMATSAGISRRTPEEADWAYYELRDARGVLWVGQGNAIGGQADAFWVGTPHGLYRVLADQLIDLS